MPQQHTVKQLFGASSSQALKAVTTAPKADTGACSKDGGQPTAAAAAAAAGGGGATAHAEQQLKENKPAWQAAAADRRPDSTQLKQSSLANIPQTAKCGGQPKQRSKPTQLYLDLGQRDFGASHCSVCGMVYTKGHEEDEKLHKAYHQGSVQGFKFQGWPQERVLVSEVAQGRLLMVLQSDPANHVKKVRELCAFVEKAHGMATGWLLSAPQARVFLYVSCQRRVVGLAVVEPLKQAYRVMAPAGSQEQEADSSARPVQQPPSILDTAGTTQQQAQKRQAQQLLWPGLRKRGRLAALGRAAGSGGNVLLSDPSLHSDSGAVSSSLRADSCPTSLLAAAGRLQVQAKSAGQAAAAAGAAHAAPAAGAAAQEDAAGAAPGSQAGCAGMEVQEGPLLEVLQPAAGAEASQRPLEAHSSQPPAQQQQQQGSMLSLQAMPPPPAQQAAGQQQQQQHAPLWRRDAAAASLHSGPAASGLTGSAGGSSGGAGVRRAGSVAAAAAAAGGSGGGRSLLVDQRRAMRALVGVRMVWVSPEQRRRGLATKLLDAARCNLMPGFVVPCNQVAFSQPTGDGVALAAAFAGTQQFLVYGLK